MRMEREREREMIRSLVTVRGNKEATGTLVTTAGDLRLRAIVGGTFLTSGIPAFDVVAGSTSGGSLTLSAEKPGSFIVDYDAVNRDVRFQFLNSVNLLDKKLNWTYAHSRAENDTVLDGTLALDPANKVSAHYQLGTRNCKLRYSHLRAGATALEPGYDFGTGSWDLSVSHRFDGDVVRGSYDTGSKVLALDWSSNSSITDQGRFKASATFNLAEGLQMPKLSAETLWTFDM